MKQLIILSTALFINVTTQAQQVVKMGQQSPTGAYDNISVQKLDSDSLVSTFLIWVKKDVPLHRHNNHSETLAVISGKAEMTLNGKVFIISKGDYIFIPKGTKHSVKVTSKEPLQVLSVQAPQYDGTDKEAINKTVNKAQNKQ